MQMAAQSASSYMIICIRIHHEVCEIMKYSLFSRFFFSKRWSLEVLKTGWFSLQKEGYIYCDLCPPTCHVLLR
jgi:hypothetical protein